jgi:hypothetical protein
VLRYVTINIISLGEDLFMIGKLDPEKGYIKGNVWVISNRANTLKNDASLQELELLVENLKKL